MSFVFIEVGQVSFVVGQVIFTFQPVLGQVLEKSICQPLIITPDRYLVLPGVYFSAQGYAERYIHADSSGKFFS